MLLIRRFEEKVEEIFTSGVVSGTVHTCIGQEAIAVGVGSVLKKTDIVTSTHRGHGHFIGKGGDPKKMMAELFGKKTGYSRGRGGSQLMADYRLGFVGANGIVGGSIPIATGIALSFKQQKLPRIAVCYFGDGAVNQGTFHESLNMASLWKLPVIYICENNHYAMSTPRCESLTGENISGKAANYGMPGFTIDGNDIAAVQEIVRNCAKMARGGVGPTLIEFETYRFSGHSRGDQRVYRSREEEKAWQKKDPIRRFRAVLMKAGMMAADDDREIKKSVRREIRDSLKFAKQSPFPDPATLNDGVFA